MLSSLKRKSVETKTKMKLFLMLALDNFIFNGFHIFKKKWDALWVQYAPCTMLACLLVYWNFKWRFINNLHLCWNVSEGQHLGFIVKLKTENSIDFLDTTAYKNKEQNKLITIVNCKPADQKDFFMINLPKLINEKHAMQSPSSTNEYCYRNLRPC